MLNGSIRTLLFKFSKRFNNSWHHCSWWQSACTAHCPPQRRDSPPARDSSVAASLSGSRSRWCQGCSSCGCTILANFGSVECRLEWRYCWHWNTHWHWMMTAIMMTRTWVTAPRRSWASWWRRCLRARLPSSWAFWPGSCRWPWSSPRSCPHWVSPSWPRPSLTNTQDSASCQLLQCLG